MPTRVLCCVCVGVRVRVIVCFAEWSVRSLFTHRQPAHSIVAHERSRPILSPLLHRRRIRRRIRRRVFRLVAPLLTAISRHRGFSGHRGFRPPVVGLRIGTGACLTFSALLLLSRRSFLRLLLRLLLLLLPSKETGRFAERHASLQTIGGGGNM